MPRRRANHEGSFYRRKSDKRWVAMQIVSKLMGHADVRTTMTNYAHVLGGDTLRAMDRLAETIDSSTTHLLQKSPRGDESAR